MECGVFSSHVLHHPSTVTSVVLIERSWYAVLETFILLAAFHQDFSVGFVTMVTCLFVIKAFHWLAGDRIDYVSILNHHITTQPLMYSSILSPPDGTQSYYHVYLPSSCRHAPPATVPCGLLLHLPFLDQPHHSRTFSRDRLRARGRGGSCCLEWTSFWEWIYNV